MIRRIGDGRGNHSDAPPARLMRFSSSSSSLVSSALPSLPGVRPPSTAFCFGNVAKRRRTRPEVPRGKKKTKQKKNEVGGGGAVVALIGRYDRPMT